MIETRNLLQAMSRTVEAARRALVWWGDELWHLLPLRVREALRADPIAVEILPPDPGCAPQTVAIQTFRSGRSAQRLQMEDWREALAWVVEKRRRWGPLMRVDLVLPASACLIRQREVPAAASNRIGEVLALELERTTPFSAQDVRQGWRRVTGSASAASLLVEHVVAKRHLSNPALAEAAALGVPIAAVDVIDLAAGSRLGVNLLEPAEVPQSLTRRLHGAIAIVAALLVIVTATAVGIAVQRQEDALARLETEIGSARKEALAARKRLQDADIAFERIGQLRQRRAQDFRVIAVWEEVTRRLPDTAWLTDMRIENNSLWLDGYARSASELVRIVAQSSMFSGVALSAPVTRDAAKAGERFQLRMKIEKFEPAQTADRRKGNG
jgi:general secretion pathway protein L